MTVLNITKKMTGKLTGIQSINTNPLTNPFCIKMSSNNSTVCSQCYSQKMLKTYRAACARPWEENGKVLSERLIPTEYLPTIIELFFRLSAHGEIINTTMYRNYLAIARKNPDTLFALWTKRKDIISRIGKEDVKNLILIYSSPILNDPSPKIPKHFDKVFTVYTPEFAYENKIAINCVKKKCIECRLCYSKNKVTHINEIIKNKQHVWLHMMGDKQPAK